MASLLDDDLIGEIAPPGSQWGVFSGGAPVITADTVTSLDYKQEWAISDFPVERGAFESYDKVALPYDARVRFAAGGSAANREALLGSIAAVAAGKHAKKRKATATIDTNPKARGLVSCAWG